MIAVRKCVEGCVTGYVVGFSFLIQCYADFDEGFYWVVLADYCGVAVMGVDF